METSDRVSEKAKPNRWTISIKPLAAFRALSIAITGGIIIACLWPFHAPANDVHWSDRSNGLQFGPHGTVVSTDPLIISGPDDDLGWSVELAIRASQVKAERHILTFYLPGNEHLLSIRQFRGSLIVGEVGRKEENNPASRPLIVDVFRPSTEIFLTVTGRGGLTSILVDGTLRQTSEALELSRWPLAGQLILADSPIITDSWSGRVDRLAIYASALNPEVVARHFQEWRQKKPPAIRAEEHPIALYPFNEGGGKIIHNLVRPGADMTIPERYLLVGKPFLEHPWDEYEPTWSYYKSVLINILGFVPFGFVWYANFSLTSPNRKPLAVLTTIILGCFTSLAMEVIQGFLPTRASGITDIITNTAGTALGVAAYRYSEPVVQKILDRILAVRANPDRTYFPW